MTAPQPKKMTVTEAAAQVENFSQHNFGKKVPQPVKEKIHGQTFRLSSSPKR